MSNCHANFIISYTFLQLLSLVVFPKMTLKTVLTSENQGEVLCLLFYTVEFSGFISVFKDTSFENVQLFCISIK